MAELTEPFASFWTFLRNNLDESRFNQMLDGLHHSLDRELQNPFAVGYTPKYLAYRTVLDSWTRGCGTDSSATKHPKINNEPQPNDQPVNIEGLKYLLQSGQERGPLLLDILEGGRASVIRHKLATALNPPKTMAPPNPAPFNEAFGQTVPQPTNQIERKFIPRGPKGPKNRRDLSSKAVFKGCDVDEIPIPPLINISRDLEPYIPKLQNIWMIWLNIDVQRRVLIFRSQEKGSRQESDDMVSDRHRQEFRYMFLSYIQECLEFNQSSNFLEFHNENYRDETESWRKMAEEVVVGIKQQYVDNGKWK
ncbi:hypothetical protein HD806DRAFT_546491 [Xylariaceae sp. AK1471]|nr:hypothetical protein HD806DRAFT_546491 [Xylariaceae sp. AK1471]